MAFKKAAPQQAFVKMSIYGPPGSGKTLTALLMAEGLAAKRGKRIAYVDTEHGTDFYAKANPSRKVHPDAFDFDAIYTRSLAAVLDEVEKIDPNTYGVVVLDSITHMWESAIDAYTGKKTSKDGIPMPAWGGIKRPYKKLMALLVAMPCDVFILGRQKNIFEGDGQEMTKVGVGIKAEGETQYEPHISARMECRLDVKDQTQSVVLMCVEKDRSSVLQGRTIPNPNFKTIEPVLAVLNDGTQAPMEDEAQRIEDDSALGEKEEAAKAAKSEAVYAEVLAGIASAKSVEDIGAVMVLAKKNKKHLSEIHAEAIRAAHKSATERLTALVAGGI